MQWAGLTGCVGNCGSHTDAPSRPSCCSELSNLRVSVCIPQMCKHYSRGPCAQPSSPPAVSLSSPEETNYHGKSIQVILDFSPFFADPETAPKIPTGVSNLYTCSPTLGTLAAIPSLPPISLRTGSAHSDMMAFVQLGPSPHYLKGFLWAPTCFLRGICL